MRHHIKEDIYCLIRLIQKNVSTKHNASVLPSKRNINEIYGENYPRNTQHKDKSRL